MNWTRTKTPADNTDDADSDRRSPFTLISVICVIRGHSLKMKAEKEIGADSRGIARQRLISAVTFLTLVTADTVSGFNHLVSRRPTLTRATSMPFRRFAD